MEKKYIVRLSDAEGSHLKEVIRALNGTSQKVRRAQILLKADADGPAWTDEKIADAFCHAGIARCEHEVAVDAELASIARRILKIPTLATRKIDLLDFHEVAVWQVLETLRLAHRMGRKQER